MVPANAVQHRLPLRLGPKAFERLIAQRTVVALTACPIGKLSNIVNQTTDRDLKSQRMQRASHLSLRIVPLRGFAGSTEIEPKDAKELFPSPCGDMLHLGCKGKLQV